MTLQPNPAGSAPTPVFASGTRGFLVAAPHSGAGKTTLTLALLRAFRQRGVTVASAKSGPDYIDPAFHAAATGRPCVNLDAYAMSPEQIRGLTAIRASSVDLFVVEGAMGLFDGAASGQGSAADLARILGLPVVLVVDCARQSQSIAALVHGFASFRADVTVAGVILNRVASPRHEAMLRQALEPLRLPVIGAVPASDDLVLPDRHLGLVQAAEHPDLDGFLEGAGARIAACLDLSMLQSEIARPLPAHAAFDRAPVLLPPPGQRIAVARDVAFAFAYPHLLAGWQAAGAELSLFSPLADEVPDPAADAIFLPGGYPELHAGPLAAKGRFRDGLRLAADRGSLIYGECGGYMTLGEALIDAQGVSHPMLGLLPLVTSFAARRRHLGYRQLEPVIPGVWPGEPRDEDDGALMGHEFHYATILHEGEADRLFRARDALGTALPDMGLRRANVLGSFAHLIGRKTPMMAET
ncbi:cobyrinate a,c-diamide synthase [Roseibium aestuarii]|uniref:Hydrogenobyrinate a,c-diamide synthase n=1 Tax=Roseibium aestuarii TaxID=2600299 RepID=A0ABW4JWG8_9HYPH|nr:cobyrinate a,c-diamide synthase [Roseibium aestuarii]